MYKFWSRRGITVFLFILIMIGNINQQAQAHDKWSLKKLVESKLRFTHQKIEQLKTKEKQQVNNLYISQQKLEDTENSLQSSQQNLSTAQTKLASLESNLNEVKRQYSESEAQMGQRLRQMYKGETVGLIHMIFASEDVSELIDRIYYQQKIAAKDRDFIRKMRGQAARLASLKYNVEYEKRDIQSSISDMHRKKMVIASNIQTTKSMIEKLRDDRATYEEAERELASQSRRLAAMINRTYRSRSSNIVTVAGFIRPIYGRITSPFGWRIHPIFRTRTFHSGLDIAGPYRSPVYASNAGTVIYSGWYGGYGKVVIINHGSYRGRHVSTLYAHLSGAAVGGGTMVRKGQVVGYEGSTGYSTGPHVHFEVRVDGQPTNPLAFINL